MMVCITWSFPFLSVATLMSTAAYWGMTAVTAPLMPCEPPPPPLPAQPPQPPLPPAPPACEPPTAKVLTTDKTKKAKKDKVRPCGWKALGNHHSIMLHIVIFLFVSLQSKKSKIKMPSLVKKWQSIQKELDEEEKSSSSDEDRDQLSKKNIEEWKQQQLMTYVYDWAHVFLF